MALIIVLLVVTGFPLHAGEYVRYRIQDTSTIRFEASTPLFSFSGRVTDVSGSLSVRRDPPAVKPGTRISVPVESIKTGIDARDSDLYALMMVDTYPRITLRADSVSQKPFDPGDVVQQDTSSAEQTVEVHGTLSIRGVSRDVTVPVTATFRDDSTRIQSRFTLDMRDYGIQPPSLYVMSVNPSVTIQVDLRTRQSR